MRVFSKKLYRAITNRFFLTAVCWILQFAAMFVVAVFFSATSTIIYVIFLLLSIILCVRIISRDDNPAYKLAWIMPILSLPIFGAALYLLLGRRNMKRGRRHRLETLASEEKDILESLPSQCYKLTDDEKKFGTLIESSSAFPVCEAENVVYYSDGESYFSALIKELEKAEKFVFLEYFIIEPGKLLDEILYILARKAESGVDVRILWDDFGCMTRLNSAFEKKLALLGIKVAVFNRVAPSLDARNNNRTHRKIAVIDGRTAFTGGINIADEYLGESKRFRRWKDTGISFCGGATDGFTAAFLTFWALAKKEKHCGALPYIGLNPQTDSEGGFIQPFASGPVKGVQLTKKVFLQIISNACKYVYINTPYLVIDNELYTALALAAESGVDVRITLPAVPDKKVVYIVSRSFYPGLIKAGVKIYEYLPGFIHSKSIVSDDKIGYVGTANMDYRSFYLHYECGAVLYKTSCLSDIKKDYLSTLEKCKEISADLLPKERFFTRIFRCLIKVFSPLL